MKRGQMFTTIETVETVRDAVATESATLLYVSTKSCGVCQVLKPKVETMIKEKFPKIQLLYVDSEATPEVAAQYSIFAVPTILVFFDGQEATRLSRHISLRDLEEKIARPYEMFFE